MAECKEIEVYKPPDLNSRLKEEEDMLERYFWPTKYPILHTENNEPYFEHQVELKEDINYKLRVYVNSNYPDQLPDLVVCGSPEPMPVDSPGWGGMHATHTWPSLYGFLHICHWHWVAWTRENMIYQVFNKGEEWLEAYEKYLVTKKLPLELEQMKLTEEERMIEQRDLRQLVQSHQQAALAMICQLDPNFRNELHSWYMRAINSGILSQPNFPLFPITAGEIVSNQWLESISQRTNEAYPIMIMLAKPNAIILMSAEPELFTLYRQWAIAECSQANPGCNNIDVSSTQTNDGRIYVSVSPTASDVSPHRPRSLENS